MKSEVGTCSCNKQLLEVRGYLLELSHTVSNSDSISCCFEAIPGALIQPVMDSAERAWRIPGGRGQGSAPSPASTSSTPHQQQDSSLRSLCILGDWPFAGGRGVLDFDSHLPALRKSRFSVDVKGWGLR